MVQFHVFTLNPGAYEMRRISEEAQALGVPIELYNYRYFSFSVEKGEFNTFYKERKINFQEKDLIFFRGIPHMSKQLFRHLIGNYFLKCDLVNQYYFTKIPFLSNKIFQSCYVGKLYPDWVIPFFYFLDKEKLDKSLFSMLKEKDFSIFKAAVGSRGREVFDIRDFEEIGQMTEKSGKEIYDYQLQKKINNQFDYRVIYLDGEIVGGIKRIAPKDDFRTNISLGGKAEYFKDLPQEVKNMVLKIADLFKIDYGGIDIIQDLNTGRYYFLEINFSCQFRGFERATGINVARKIVEFAWSKMNSHLTNTNFQIK